GMNVGGKEGQDAEDGDEELYRDVNINLEGIDSLFESTPRVDVQATTIVASLTFTAPTIPPPTILTIFQVPQAPTPPTTAPSTFLQNLPNFGSLIGFDHLKVVVQIQSDRLQDEAQAENEEFLNNLDNNIQKIIKEQVKEQVKTSYVVAADPSEMELKKILIKKMESNKSIHRSDEQRNLYKALVNAYECDNIILDTYEDIVTLKRRRDDADKDEEPSQYPHNLLKPLPLIPNSRGRRVIPFNHFINKDLEYLCGGASSHKYTTSVTKTKAVDHGHIKWIEDMVPHTMCSQELVSYDRYALWGIFHWGRKRQQLYGFAFNREYARDGYSKRRIIAVTELLIVEWHNYKHLDWITVRRHDDKLYEFKEGDFKRLRIQDIEDMLLLLRWDAQCLIDEVTGVQNVFKQMELAVEQHCEEKNKFHDKTESVLKDNDRLLQKAITVDIVNLVLYDNVNVDCMNVNACKSSVTAESELQTNFIQKEHYDTLLQKFNILEKHCILLEVDNQLKKETFQKNTLFFSRREFEEIETLNIELDHKVTKLVAENEHLKQTYNLQEKVLVITALKEQLNKLKGKAIVTEAVSLNLMDLELLKI
nr:hypothetical protein [Tanacetum cinerariifolium]